MNKLTKEFLKDNGFNLKVSEELDGPTWYILKRVENWGQGDELHYCTLFFEFKKGLSSDELTKAQVCHDTVFNKMKVKRIKVENELLESVEDFEDALRMCKLDKVIVLKK